MQLDIMLQRCGRLEERAAGVYRRYAAAARTEPPVCALWTALAREEEEHAASIALARTRLSSSAGWQTRLDGFDEVLDDVERRLEAAEHLGPDAGMANQLSAALELEMSELETLRREVLRACGERYANRVNEHALRLADAAERLSNDPQLRLQAALLKARLRVKTSE